MIGRCLLFDACHWMADDHRGSITLFRCRGRAVELAHNIKHEGWKMNLFGSGHLVA